MTDPVYLVITAVPGEGEGGNMAAALGEVHRGVGDQGHGMPERYEPILSLDLFLPVFHVGEVLIVEPGSEREYGYPGRKPSKWQVTYERYADVQAACRRAQEVIDA